MRITYLFLIVGCLFFVGCSEDFTEGSQLETAELESRDCGCTVSIEVVETNEYCALKAVPGEGCSGDISYSWNTGQQFPFISVLGDAVFCVTITDASGCTAEACINLVDCEEDCDTEDCDLEIEVTNCEAWAQVTGCAVSSYIWTYPNGGTAPGRGVTVSTNGTYCVEVTLTNGCTLNDCVTITDCVDCDNGCELDIVLSPFGQTCQLTANTNNCVGPVVYEWEYPSGGQVISQSVIASANGTYCVTATQANGCEVSDCFTVVDCEESCTEPEMTIQSIPEFVNSWCDGINTNILVRPGILSGCNQCCSDLNVMRSYTINITVINQSTGIEYGPQSQTHSEIACSSTMGTQGAFFQTDCGTFASSDLVTLVITITDFESDCELVGDLNALTVVIEDFSPDTSCC